jgi:hypothetical protein
VSSPGSARSSLAGADILFDLASARATCAEEIILYVVLCHSQRVMAGRREFGRTGLVDQVGRSEAPLTLVTGDSGIGKSKVLDTAAGLRADWFNAPSQRLAPSSGAVQRAVLVGLADLVAQAVAERGALIEIADRVGGVTKRLLTTTSQELGKVVAAELLALVRGRLGEDVGKALGQFVKSLRDEMSETLMSRLYTAVDESMAETLAAFAKEVAEFGYPRRVSLSFDAGERLTADERRLLVDLAERIPANCHIRAVFATDLPERRGAVGDLRALSEAVLEIEVPPLGQDAIREWLDAEELGEVDASLVERATGGYPLHIDDLVRHLKQGGSIMEAPLNAQIAQRTEMAWRALPHEVATTARVLCVLPDPLPEERLLKLTGMSEPEYGHVVQQLEWARFFPVRVNGQPWFHEQRREFVLRQLSDGERDGACTRAAAVVWDEVLARENFLYVDLFARLAEGAKTLQGKDRRLAAAVALPEQELAVAASLLELMLPQKQGASDAQELVRHARRFTDQAIDPTSVFRNLEQTGLIAFARNERLAIVLPSWSAQAAAVIHGRAWRTLKRAPIPELTPLAYEVGLRPLFGEFEAMQFGVGFPSTALLSRMAAGADPEATLPIPRVDRRRLGTNLVVRARFGGRPMYTAARFRNEEARAAAAERLTEASAEIFGESLEIVDVMRHPLESVAALRFVRAAERAFGARSSDARDFGEMRIKLPEPLAYEQAMEVRVAATRFMRERASDLERRAMELDAPYAIYWDHEGDVWIECTVQGGHEGAVRVPGLLTQTHDPLFDFFVLEQAIGLQEGAYIRQVREGAVLPTKEDPVFAEVGRRRSDAREFNSAQPRLRVVLESELLEPLVSDGFFRMMADARAFQALAVTDAEELPPTALYVLVVLEEPSPGWIAGAGSSVTTLERVSDSGQDEIQFELVQGTTDRTHGFPSATPSSESLFGERFGFGYAREVPGFLRGMHSGIESLLSSYAGYAPDDVDFRWPGQEW